ncbi:MAG: EamA family transporter [Burkholderiaceae bacterium]|jgi:small multidrug resistance pump|nr:EamA family transporter [Burkholderiaceae bacterium]
MNPWLPLGGAIVAEVISTSALKTSDGLTRLGPTLVVIVGYSLAFWLLALALRGIPVGVAYAIWAGLGTVLIAVIGWLVFGQRLDVWAIVGMTLIVAGVLVMNLLSKSSA